MDLQTRKLNAIAYLIRLQDEEAFSKIETTILESQKEKERDTEPFTSKQLLDRARKSNKDYLAGRFKSQKQVERESKSW